jgi:hypothetical protein
MGWQESPEDAEREIEAAIPRRVGKGTVVLTDMFGERRRTEPRVSGEGRWSGHGVNSHAHPPRELRGKRGDLRVVAAQAMREGKENVYPASDLLASQEGRKSGPVAEKRVQIVNVLGFHAQAPPASSPRPLFAPR